jgi:hypothetical protein
VSELADGWVSAERDDFGSAAGGVDPPHAKTSEAKQKSGVIFTPLGYHESAVKVDI